MEEKLNKEDWEILTDDGFKSFNGITKNININSLKLIFDDHTEFICSEDHEILTNKNRFTVARKSRNKKIKTKSGYKIVKSIKRIGKLDLYDVIGVEGSRYYTDGIISHNCNLLDEFWSSVYPIISSSKKSKVIMASTPKDTTGLFYKLYIGSVKKTNNWSHMKVTWDQVPGRDEKWKRETMNSLNDDNAWKREFECSFDEVGESAIDGDLFEKMKKHTFDPLYIYDEGHYLMWENPNEERLYVAGVDVAEGIGKDATVIQVLDITNPQRIKQVAIYYNNKLAPVEFTPKLREILQHWGDPLVLIERNNCGGIVVDNLKKDFNYENIINWGIDRVVNRKSNKLGIVSHTNTKYHAILNQRYWINTCKYVQINDINTVLELNEFVRQKNGSWGARNGEHDDRVMALCWALMILHDDIVNVYFEVIDKDENGKPAILKTMDYGIKYFVNPSSIYTNEKNGIGGDALPIVMGGFNQNNPDLDDLSNQGWVPLM